MRILHVIESLEFGGAEKIVISLANHMAASHEVAVCCVKAVGALGPELDPRIRAFSLGKGEGNELTLPLRLARVLREGRYDVVHTHNWGVFLEGTLAAVLARVPVRIHTVHGPYTAYGGSASQRFKRALRHFLERRAARRVHRIAAVSDAIRDYITREIGVDPGAVVTLHNGIPVDGPPPAARESPGPAVFITVGRLAAIKNHDLMLRAFRRALDAGASARLVVVGDGPERAAVERRVRDEGLQDRVDLLGFRSDVGELLGGADVFILTSRYEGISVALLEAMRAGLPVIATNVGGIPETVRDGETGLLAGADDVEGIARAIAELAGSAPRRRELGRRGVEFLLEEFSARRMTQRYLDLYGPGLAA